MRRYGWLALLGVTAWGYVSIRRRYAVKPPRPRYGESRTAYRLRIIDAKLDAAGVAWGDAEPRRAA